MTREIVDNVEITGNLEISGTLTLSDFTNAQHDHSDVDDGGTIPYLPTTVNSDLAGTVTGEGRVTFQTPFTVDQASTTGARPVIVLDQADVDQPMIEFVTTIGVGNAIEAVGAKTLTTTHFIMVQLPGGLIRYIPCGTIA